MPTLNYHDDLKTRLASKECAAVYLETAFRESCHDQDWAAFGLSLRQVIEAQAREVAQLARDSGVTRQPLSLSFGKNANPTMNTLVPVLAELDLSIGIRPQSAARRKASARSR